MFCRVIDIYYYTQFLFARAKHNIYEFLSIFSFNNYIL